MIPITKALLLVNKERYSLYFFKNEFEMQLVQNLNFFFKTNQFLHFLLDSNISFL